MKVLKANYLKRLTHPHCTTTVYLKLYYFSRVWCNHVT